MDKMIKARIALILDHPFFGSLALRLKLKEDLTCKTAYTDGVILGFNPFYTNALSFKERGGLIAHEVMHVALCHHLRRGDRDPKGWNIAGDFAINDILEESGFVLPQGVLTGMGTHRSADTIYQKLPEKIINEPTLIDFGEVRDYPGKDGLKTTPSQANQAAQEVKILLTQSATQAKAMGKFPLGLSRMVEAIVHPKADWREILRRFMGRVSTDDYAWTPPNRRFVHQGLYLPSLRSNGIIEGTVAVDTSGSVTDLEVSQFSAEILTRQLNTITMQHKLFLDA
jgi:predicted metal-dependent peptidase